MTCCCGPVRLVHNTSRYFIYGNYYVPSMAQEGKQCVQNKKHLRRWGREAKNATEKGKEIPGLRNGLFAFASHVLTAYDLCKFDLAPINNCMQAFFAVSVKTLEIVRSNFINR